jgi:diguanylate cyclase (GGDEF)-like protein
MIVLIVGAAVAGCTVLAAVGYFINLIEVGEAVHDRADAIARRIDLFVTEGTVFQTQESVDRMRDAGAFAAAVVFSPGRELIASTPVSAELGPALGSWPESDGALEHLGIGDLDCVAVSVPLVTGGRAWIAFDWEPYRKAESRLRLAWAAAGGAVVLLAFIVAMVVGGAASRRLRAIREVADRIAEGDFQARCEETGAVEIRDLARGVNELAAKLGATITELGNERSALEQQVSGRTRELEQANRLLMDIANRDALTGLANRRRLEIELERNISFSKRTGQPLAVIMMDLDKFKICNDTAGHLVGDNILRAVASTLRSRVRVTDLVVRWGGDEFCILVPATQPQGAIAAAESLVDAVKEATAAIALPEPLEPPTASAGVACFPEDGEDPHTLILNADAALYQVKATGRGRVLRYSPGFQKD